MTAIWPDIGIERLFDLSSLAALVRGAQAWLLEQLQVASTGVLVHESGGVLLGVLARFRNDVLAAFLASELETL